MKLLKLTQAQDDNVIFVKVELLATFSSYDNGASVEITTGSIFVVKESIAQILAMLYSSLNNDVTVTEAC